MSQTVKLNVAFLDREALRRACSRMGIKEPVQNTVDLYQRKETGDVIMLPGWDYPVVVSPDGQIKFDNYEGNWGDMSHLDQLTQFYVIEAARIQAEGIGAVCTENELEDGTRELLLDYASA